MKQFLRMIACLMTALILVGVLVSCNGTNREPEDTGAGTSETPSSDESNEKESEGEQEPPRTYDVWCGVPLDTPAKTLVCGDGSFARKYTNATRAKYDSIRTKYLQEGYTEYCARDTANTVSATFVGGDTYATVFFRKNESDLVLVTSEKDGKKLPFETQSYTKVCETTFTQPGLTRAGGMCEIIRLSDGRFLIFDSGHSDQADVIYETLCELNGSAENIRIAAWVLTHSHGDHYGGFQGDTQNMGFADQYGKKVTLEYVLYAPLAMQEWDTMESYNVSWNTIDHYFNTHLPSRVAYSFPKATLVPVHAGQVFRFADVSLEILYSPEHIYIDSVPVNSNNTSLTCRAVSEHGGAALIMADCETEAGLWVADTYTTELTANIMQMTHHGMIAEADLDIMKKSGATTFFWPSGEDKYNNTDRSEKMAKQYAARYGENILHGYGTMTRPLDHVGTPAGGLELLRDGLELTTNGVAVTQNNSAGIVYQVTNAADPYIAFETNIDTSSYKALVITVRGVGQTETGSLSYTSGSMTPLDFTNGNVKTLGAQGSPYTGFTDRKLIVYLGNGEDFTGKVTSIRIDLGVANATITITSIQAYKI